MFHECLVLARTLLCITGYKVTDKKYKAIWEKLYFRECIK